MTLTFVNDDDVYRPEGMMFPEIERKGATIEEFKFVGGDDQPGVFEGYGAVFNNIDSHGDMILKGAFAQSIADHKARGTMPGLYAEHSIYKGGDLLPSGGWLDMGEDDHGLRVKGKISALDTDQGRRLRSLMQDRFMRGLSIAFRVPKGGAIYGSAKKADEPKRTLKTVDLVSIDIVRDPSNALATVESVKTLMTMVDREMASKAVASAIALHCATMTGQDSPTADERAQMLEHLRAAHKALTGAEMPAGMKAMPKTIREIERCIREMFSLSNTQAREVAKHGFKSLLPREEGQDEAAATTAALHELAPALAGFSLPKF